jgi:DNA-binding NarL/FixJ family response regulator
VLVVSVSAGEADVADAILAGASAYVVKGGPVEEVVAAVRAAAAGESPISPRLLTALLRRLRDMARADEDLSSFHLSSRELEVLDLLAEDLSTSEIAEALEITPGAVLSHTSSIFIKLQAEHR